MNFDLNKHQRIALFIAAIVIIVVQLSQFDRSGVDGQGWIFSFLIAGGLIVLGLGKNASQTLSPKSFEPNVALPNKEELAASHALLRQNAEVLLIELEQRASALATELIEKRDTDLKGLELSVQGNKKKGEQLLEQMDLYIHECCHYLMLGLIGLRRSNGNEMYVNGIEFRELQTKTSKKILEISVSTIQKAPIPLPVNAEAIGTSINSNIQQIRKALTHSCIAKKFGEPKPERLLLEWFESTSGLKIEDNSQIQRAIQE